MAIPKRNQKAITEDPNVLLRIGKMSPFKSNKTENKTTLEIFDDGNSKCILSGWRFGERKFDTQEQKKKACQTVPMLIELSRSKPNLVIRKKDNISNEKLDQIIEFLNQMPNMLNRSDPNQFDRFTEEAIGPKASADWFFEDMRAARDFAVSANDDTVEIGAKLHAMKGNDKALRDALFLIGESPEREDSTSDLYFMLSAAVISDPKAETRRKFIKYFVRPDMNPKEKEIQKWINKGVAAGVIEERSGFLVYGSERLGVSDREAVECLNSEDDLYKSLKVSVSNATGIKEDIEEANKVVDAANGTADEARAIAYVSELMKKNGLAKRPDLVLKGIDTLEDAVKKYNESAKSEGLTAKDFITAKGVSEEIGA